jgi:hypothetical protein
VKPVTTVAATFVATHAQHIELADKVAEDGCAVAGHAPNYDKLGFLWLIDPLAILADERTDAGAFRQAFSIQNTVRERLAGHHEKHEDHNCDEVVSAFHLNAPRIAHRPLHCLRDMWGKLPPFRYRVSQSLSEPLI